MFNHIHRNAVLLPLAIFMSATTSHAESLKEYEAKKNAELAIAKLESQLASKCGHSIDIQVDWSPVAGYNYSGSIRDSAAVIGSIANGPVSEYAYFYQSACENDFYKQKLASVNALRFLPAATLDASSDNNQIHFSGSALTFNISPTKNDPNGYERLQKALDSSALSH